MKIYAYPDHTRHLAFFAALDDKSAERINAEARPATVEELSAAFADAAMVPAYGLRGARRTRRPYAEVSDFLR